MPKARYHKLRLQFSLWCCRMRNSWSKWWNKNVGSIRLTRRGVLGIYLLLVLLMGTVLLSRFQARLGQNIGLENDSLSTNHEDSGKGYDDIWGEQRQPTNPGTQTDTGNTEPKQPSPAKASGEAGIKDEREVKPAEPVIAQVQLERLYVPLADAAIQTPFALSVKSITLGDWRSHLAVDFAIQGEAEVLAAAAGTVSKILTNDPYWGTVMMLDHGGGWVTNYSNITNPTVRVGERVAARQVIGQVTENPPIELLDPLHLHFTLLQNGQPVDPSSKWNE